MFNAANEVMVDAFLTQNARFTSIVDTVERVVRAADEWHREPRDLEDVFAAERWARTRAAELNSSGRK